MNTQTNNTVHRAVMRRVYLSYTLSVVWSWAALAGAVFMVSLFSFAKLVHVARVWEAFLNQPVREVPAFTLSLLMKGEVLTLLSIIALLASCMVLLQQLRRIRPHHLTTHRIAL